MHLFYFNLSVRYQHLTASILFMPPLKLRILSSFILTACLVSPVVAQMHVIGWQTFENATLGDNNSTIQDTSPDTNSTYDSTPIGSNSGSLYLTGAIGTNASNLGYSGFGQATNNDFLNGPSFGSNLTITDYTLADGSPGQRIGPYNNPSPNGAENNGTSSWKFSQQNGVFQLSGDFSITNHSNYFFQLENIHFDARGYSNESTSPKKLELRYLATNGLLVNLNTQSEVPDQQILYTSTWTSRSVKEVSQSLASVIGSEVRIPPGQTARFRFTWSEATGNGHAQIDNLALSGTFLDSNNNFSVVDPTTSSELSIDSTPNIIVILPDDQRWDATSYMQNRMSSLGRIPRFPWLGSPTSTTPNMDRLSTEGIHFDNAFSVYSLCSPARATMLTGQHAHIHGVTDNDTHFPLDAVTYATALQDAGYTTAYFGKWHMGTQDKRPGFTQAATYHGQGTYFQSTFYDQNGNWLFNTSASDWVDDISTQQALNFINAQYLADNPFMLVLGFKTPHSPREPPARSSSLFSSDSPADVPNLTSPPPFAPNTYSGYDLTDLRNYMRTIVGIDQNVGEVLDLLDSLSIASNTAVIFISDQGYFRGEHRLGDKRAPYEESIRIPLMIRYPDAQSAASVVGNIALNLDLAPTILDIAGVDIPESMQGKSLLPLISGQTPANWRDSFLFSYNHDPEFPTAAVRPYLAIRHKDGTKLVTYPENSAWNELYKTDTSNDPYETLNLYASTSENTTRNNMEALLLQQVNEQGFLKIKQSTATPDGGALTLQAGNSSHFILEASADLSTWNEMGRIEGNGTESTLSLIHPNSTSSLTITGHTADYTLTEGPPVSTNQGYSNLVSGSQSPYGGREAVLIFELPQMPASQELAKAQIEISAKRQYAKWDSDLWTLGIYNNTSAIIEYSENPSGDPAVIKLQDAFLTDLLGTTFERISSSPISRLTHYLQSFYNENPTYTDGKYLFLRINPNWDIGVNNQQYSISSAQHADSSQHPQLHLYFREASIDPAHYFHRVRYGND
ncbi:MAG: Arylsulfatase [Opitutia bacterium UBA7350]|nr:MAG: Arylsulfatase [Opitutae bacterium UBA7350]